MIIDIYKLSLVILLMVDNKKVAWNTSQGLIAEISNRRSYANTFFVNGDIKKAFNTLISIKQSVIQSFEDEERKKLEKMENQFNQISSYISKNSALSFNKKTNNQWH